MLHEALREPESLDALDERASDPSLGDGLRAATHLKSLRSKTILILCNCETVDAQ